MDWAVETSMFVCTCIMASSPVTMHVHTVWIARSGTAWSGCALRDQWPCFYGDTDTIWKKLQAIINSVLLAASPANQQYFSLTPNQHQPVATSCTQQAKHKCKFLKALEYNVVYILPQTSCHIFYICNE